MQIHYTIHWIILLYNLIFCLLDPLLPEFRDIMSQSTEYCLYEALSTEGWAVESLEWELFP